MPELPEVETTRRALAPHLTGRTITDAVFRTARLRSQLSPELAGQLAGQRINVIDRRGKYLLFGCSDGTILLHLGMTGQLHLVPEATTAGRFDHVELALDSGLSLRLADPRKFGTLLWLTLPPEQHPLLSGLGPEPLENCFTAAYLYRVSRDRRTPIKVLIMDNRVVTGVGNIYAGEALFRARLNPARRACSLTEADAERLCNAIRLTLAEAIAIGEADAGRFLDSAMPSGYFKIDFQVYGRGGEPCRTCGTPLARTKLGGRTTCWCPACQPG